MNPNHDSHAQNRSDLSHPRLSRQLYDVARRLRDSAILKHKVRPLLATLFLSVPLCIIGYIFPALAPLSLYLIALTTVAALIFLWIRERKQRLDYLTAAIVVEEENPSLNQSLITAVEKTLSERPSFFLDGVAEKALSHPSRDRWNQAGRRILQTARLRYLGTLALLLFVSGASFIATQRPVPIAENPAPTETAVSSVTVAPGDVEVQRGSSLVITARFEGALPREATLVALSDTGEERRSTMAQRLSDPVFAYTLQRIDQGMRYQIEYAGQGSENYRIEIYELPDLAQADAALDYPDYTHWQDRTIQDTRRISAIEGSGLQYFFNTTKPVAEAYLIDDAGQKTELESDNEQSTRFVFRDTLQESRRYALHLIDHKNRKNALPPEIRLDVLPNKRPELRFEIPRGDQRVSPIEELALRGSARDDFGLIDYGVALVFGAQEPEITSLKQVDQDDRERDAHLSMLVPLETYDLQPKDTLSWYLWAKDHDANGEPRTSTSDLFFGDVRPLDEIFREQDAGSGGQGGQGNQGQEMIEKQRRISISLFRINNNETKAIRVVEDLDAVQRSQQEVQDELRQLVPELQDPAAKEAATSALRFMEGTYVSLNTAIDEPSLDPLDAAWIDSQGAYQELIKLTESEYNVSRSQNGGGGGGSRQSRNQAQLDQLEFRQNESRYEKASEAQSLTTPEERQNLELMSKLNELSRRQQDMNDRLQEMQSAMAEAQTEEERERIRRELKRLEDEQRELLSQADEAIQQAGNRQNARDTRDQLEEARENMRESSEQLEKGEVSQALASGTRARETIEQTREQMRNETSSQFSDAMRQARSQARELAEQQKDLERQIDELNSGESRRLDDSKERDEIVRNLETQSQALDEFLESLREVTEGSEAAEPALHRKLYQVLRDTNAAQFEEQYGIGAQLLQQGFIDDAKESQEGIGEALDEMSERIAEAAESILGNETTTLRFAQDELDSLTRQLEKERVGDALSSENEADANPASNPDSQRPGSDLANSESESGGSTRSERGEESPGSTAGSGRSSIEQMIQNALEGLEQANSSPLTGNGFSEWVDRLRTVESLMEEPETRARVAEARETAEELRRDFKRHGSLPQWTMIEGGIVEPLKRVESWVRDELNRRVSPDTLQPVDRDPVPQEYIKVVRRYYESLGE